MESEHELIDLVASVCEELGLPYAIGGSLASMTYGELRMTHDIDVVISLHPADVPRFLACFPFPDYYHDERAAQEAVRTGGQFNVILTKDPLKIDVHVAADEIAQRQITRSRRLKSPSGRLANFSPPEELIIKKLVYYDFSASESSFATSPACSGSPAARSTSTSWRGWPPPTAFRTCGRRCKGGCSAADQTPNLSASPRLRVRRFFVSA